MNNTYSIKEISSLLGIPKSTLRYWEEKGLIQLKRNRQNEYREFTLQSALDISDIAFYRSLDISIQELKKLSSMSVEELDNTLKKTEEQVQRDFLALQKKQERLKKQRYYIKEILRLQKKPYQQGYPDLKTMVKYNTGCKEHWQATIEKPYFFSIMIEYNTPEVVFYGVADRGEKEKESVIWSIEEHSGNYLECLLKTTSENLYCNNALEHLAAVKSLGKKPIRLIARYLVSGFDTIKWDYYKAWIELADEN